MLDDLSGRLAGAEAADVPLTAAQLGTGDMVEMAIDVDKTFKPGGADPRELGIRVYHTFIEPKYGPQASRHTPHRAIVGPRRRLDCSVSGQPRSGW